MFANIKLILFAVTFEVMFPSGGTLRPRQSAGINVSATASEETPSCDDTHIITDDATELIAAAFRAKVREHGNILAAQRIAEDPSPVDSADSSTTALPILGRSVSQQRAPAALACSSSEEHTRMGTTNSDTTIMTDISESSWALDESQRSIMNRHIIDKNRNRDVHRAIAGTRAKGEKVQHPVELTEEDDLSK